MWKHYLSVFLILTTIVPPGAMASKIQQQGIVTAADCTARGISNANCIPLSSQVYDSTNGQLLSVSIANGALGGGGASQNILTNAGFETGTAQTGWTADTVSKANETTNVFEKLQSVALTYSSQSGGIHQDVTPPTATAAIQTSGVAMVASCRIKTTLTDIQVCARSNAVNTLCTTVASNGNWVIQPVNFTGPANGTSVGVAVASVGSDTGTVYVDDCYVGAASTPQNFGQVSQATLYGKVSFTGCTTGSWSTSSTTFASLGTDTGCTVTASGNATAPGSPYAPAITFPTVPPGEYVVVVDGTLQNSGTGNESALRVTDGTNNSKETEACENGGSSIRCPIGASYHFSYTTTQSNLTFSVQGKTSSGTGFVLYNDASRSLTMKVYRFPASTEVAYRPDLQPTSWSGYSAGISSGCSTTSGSFGDPSACTGIGVTQLTARNMTCSQNSTLPSISCTVPKPGMYFVNAVVTLRSSVASGSNIFARLVDGSGNEVSHGNAAQMVQNNGQVAFPLSGLYSSSGLAPVWKVQFYNDSGATTSIVNVGANTAAINWSVMAADQSLASPALMGSVTSSDPGMFHQEFVSIDSAKCTTSTCTMNKHSSGITSVTRSSTGQYVINFVAGVFSSAPACTISTNTLGSTIGVCGGNGASTTALKNVECENNSFALQDDGFDAICMGPR